MIYYVKESLTINDFGDHLRKEFVEDIMNNRGMKVNIDKSLRLSGEGIKGSDGGGHWFISPVSLERCFIKTPPNCMPEELFKI